MKIDPDGYRFFALFLIPALILGAVYHVTGNRWILAFSVLTGVLSLYTLYFFRDPERIPATGDAACAISAADGVVVDVSMVTAEGFENGSALRIAVFMNVFNVHVNRTPLPGTVTGTSHTPGRKLSAYNARAEHENEHGDTDITTPYGPMRIRQIAGLVARRVVTRVEAGDNLSRGDRIGLIRFGSRVDVFLPVGFEPKVAIGDKVQAGVTVIASAASGR
jgi:phosphatidylserine decarboxylase